MSAARKVFDVTSTSSYVAVANFDIDTTYSHILVENYTDGDVYVAFGDQTHPDIICVQNTDKILDSFNVIGTMYVKNNTGTGGRVVISLWRD